MNHTISIYCMLIYFLIKQIQALTYFHITYIFALADSDNFLLHYKYLWFLIWVNISVPMSLKNEYNFVMLLFTYLFIYFFFSMPSNV